MTVFDHLTSRTSCSHCSHAQHTPVCASSVESMPFPINSTTVSTRYPASRDMSSLARLPPPRSLLSAPSPRDQHIGLCHLPTSIPSTGRLARYVTRAQSSRHSARPLTPLTLPPLSYMPLAPTTTAATAAATRTSWNPCADCQCADQCAAGRCEVALSSILAAHTQPSPYPLPAISSQPYLSHRHVVGSIEQRLIGGSAPTPTSTPSCCRSHQWRNGHVRLWTCSRICTPAPAMA